VAGRESLAAGAGFEKIGCGFVALRVDDVRDDDCLSGVLNNGLRLDKVESVRNLPVVEDGLLMIGFFA